MGGGGFHRLSNLQTVRLPIIATIMHHLAVRHRTMLNSIALSFQGTQLNSIYISSKVILWSTNKINTSMQTLYDRVHWYAIGVFSSRSFCVLGSYCLSWIYIIIPSQYRPMHYFSFQLYTVWIMNFCLFVLRAFLTKHYVFKLVFITT